MITITGCILAFLSGCAPTATMGDGRFPITPNDDRTDTSSTTATISILSQSQLADQSDSNILQAAILFSNAGEISQSSELLSLVNPDNLTDDLFVEYSHLAAELNVMLRQWLEALSWFKQPRYQDLSLALAKPTMLRSLRLQSAAHYALGNVESGLILVMDIALLTTEKAERLQVHNSPMRSCKIVLITKIEHLPAGFRLQHWRVIIRQIKTRKGNNLRPGGCVGKVIRQPFGHPCR